MKSKQLGENTSNAEVANISTHGFWLLVQGKEYFLPFEDYPWFRDAKVKDILHVELLHENHLHWPSLDIDLELESLESPETYPLTYK